MQPNCLGSKRMLRRMARRRFQKRVKRTRTCVRQRAEGIYVWQPCWNGIQCVVHPYLKHTEEQERSELLTEIRLRLETCFVKHHSYFAESDQRWHHIGWFNGTLYLFDLADLETERLEDSKALVDAPIERLRQCTDLANSSNFDGRLWIT